MYDIGELQCKFNAYEHLAEKKDLKTITLTAKAFAAFSNKGEINVNGTLYDVQSYRISGDVVFVTVWHDAQEEVLQHEIVSLFENQEQISGTTHSSNIAKYHPYFPDVKIIPTKTQQAFFTFRKERADYTLPKVDGFYILPLVDVISPPPDLC